MQNGEKDVARLTQEKASVEKKLADPKIYDGGNDDLTRLQIQLGKIDKDLEKAENAWLAAQAELEVVAPE